MYAMRNQSTHLIVTLLKLLKAMAVYVSSIKLLSVILQESNVDRTAVEHEEQIRLERLREDVESEHQGRCEDLEKKFAYKMEQLRQEFADKHDQVTRWPAICLSQ